MSYITIDNVDYSIIDTKEKMTIPDCFVVDSNKVGTGHGEAKFMSETTTNQHARSLEKTASE